VGIAVAARKLREAQAIAMRVEPHRLGIDRHRVTEQQAFGQVSMMQMISHAVLPDAIPGSPRSARPRRASITNFINKL